MSTAELPEGAKKPLAPPETEGMVAEGKEEVATAGEVEEPETNASDAAVALVVPAPPVAAADVLVFI